jgi:thiol-disulfide isomerase/thioredoxin
MISGIEMLKVGEIAPDFSVMDMGGANFNLKEALGAKKGMLIFFWSIFCEPCKEELPIIQELADVYQAQDVDFVGVAIDGGPMKEAINGYITQEGYSFKPLIDELNPDESFKISDPYGVAGTPTLYIIDKDGVVKFAKVGKATKEELEQIIKQVL